MADTRFFRNAGPFSLRTVAATAVGEIADTADTEALFSDVKPLSEAGPDEVSFLDNKKYIDQFKTSAAGACIAAPEMQDIAPPTMTVIATPTPYHGYARVAQLFYPAKSPKAGISAQASVAATANVSNSAEIAAFSVIGGHAAIGDGTVIGSNTVIGDGVTIGANCNIAPSVTILAADVGDHVVIHSGVRVGQDGFGFAMGPSGHIKVPQLGRVIIGNNVEIGANSTIDRGTGPDTVIGSGTKIDNLVQIGHNVVVGEHCVLVSHVGISGSTELGDFVVLAGQVGVAGHLKIGAGAKVAAQSGVMRNVEPMQEIGGSPAKPVKKWFREIAMIERMAKRKGN